MAMESIAKVFQVNSFTLPKTHKVVDEKIRGGLPTGRRIFKNFSCKYCGISFVSEYFLLRHMQLHLPDMSGKMVEVKIQSGENMKLHNCQICKDTCKCNHMKGVSKNTEVHETASDISTLKKNITTYQCRQCGESFNTASERTTHRQEAHSKPWKCTSCNDSFDSQARLEAHLEWHEVKPSQLSCHLCGKGFKLRINLKIHVESRCGTEPPHTCEECGKSFMSRGTLASHRLVHTGEKTFLCGYCGKCFRLKVEMQRHERLHTGEKPFVCKVCGKAFAHRESLVTHNTLHTGLKPYMCESCGCTYSCIGNLIKHQKSHHNKGGVQQKMPVRTDSAKSAESRDASSISGLSNGVTWCDAPLVSTGDDIEKLLTSLNDDQQGNWEKNTKNSQCYWDAINVMFAQRDPSPPLSIFSAGDLVDYLPDFSALDGNFGPLAECITENDENQSHNEFDDSCDSISLDGGCKRLASILDVCLDFPGSSLAADQAEKKDVACTFKSVDRIFESLAGVPSEKWDTAAEANILRTDFGVTSDLNKNLELTSSNNYLPTSNFESESEIKSTHMIVGSDAKIGQEYIPSVQLHIHDNNEKILEKGEEQNSACKGCDNTITSDSNCHKSGENSFVESNNLGRNCSVEFRSLRQDERAKQLKHQGKRRLRPVCKVIGRRQSEAVDKHQGRKVLYCHFCGKSYRLIADLRLHERSHMGPKPFTCRICGKAFPNRDGMIAHSEMHGDM